MGVITWFSIFVPIVLVDDGLWTTIVWIFIDKTNPTITTINSAQKSASNYACEQSVIIMLSFIILYCTGTLQHIAGKNRIHQGSIPSFADPKKIISTDYEQWKQDTVSIKINCADEALEITLVERSPPVRYTTCYVLGRFVTQSLM
ncbi:uncharacterized protein MELLADRAFT_67242 [Melampsora larici-populina 98AG31]|uniref:Uncharacterized protein n=1 Tax=Melampsora larici-populina (strain 98AG31 / pathotype 3-4-7) TaxID=747676 RepID=F4S2B8_MELLP|nr:uncharacterized protein MELLADRAFT_67242 [Melampsora larici-populina 98AG31]EGG01230.1 hypothetical protein MELLADRAFT_67242 [Melampsora larici-populina 98AG31]